MSRAKTNKTAKLTMTAAAMLFMAVLLASSALAIGIAPSKAAFPFQPSGQINYDLDIVNNAAEDLEVLLYAKGEFSDKVTIEPQMLKMSASENSRKVTVKLTMPERMQVAGTHTIDIFAVGTTPADSGERTVVKADVAVISKLLIEVPYPEKYAEAALHVLDTEEGRPTQFSIAVFNKGNEDISQAYAEVQVYDSETNTVDVVQTEKTAIPAGKDTKLTISSSKMYSKGHYTVKAIVYYDGRGIQLQGEFDVGEVSIDIKSLVVDSFTLGGVAKFDLLLYNNWDSELKNVYAEMQITGEDNKEYTNFKTVATDIQPKQVGRLEGYWYTEGVMPGIYTATITLHYANRISQKQFELEVQPNAIIARALGTGQAISAADAVDFKNNAFLILVILVMAAVIAVLVYKLRRTRQRPSTSGPAAPAAGLAAPSAPATPTLQRDSAQGKGGQDG
ncbi:hypothetical protein KY359_05910 [Candidatus Woesearchaeota archaeon]|nr:hypothetical protein [Candidatus Woesearchaeota archaeon]